MTRLHRSLSCVPLCTASHCLHHTAVHHDLISTCLQHDIALVMISIEVRSESNAGHRRIHPEANELLLFHGCEESVVELIIRDGFDEHKADLESVEFGLDLASSHIAMSI